MIETGRPRQSWNGWGSRPTMSVLLGDLYLITEGAAAIFSR